MCDTIVALGPATRGGVMLFGKNSDRDPDEVQNIHIYPRRQFGPRDEVRCTYLTIPQAARTNRVLLCRPFWMFGAEMGANEHGLTIGNEALFTKEKPEKSGLTGMDLLRLALERCGTARQALECIIGLLEEHGQGGNCGYRKPFFYMNGFLIADAREAYVLETVGKWWAWKRIEDLWSISNVISLESDYDAASPGLIDNARKKGWCKKGEEFNFRDSYSDPLITWGAAAKNREGRSRRLLEAKKGSLTSADFMEILRDHGGGDGYSPDKRGATLCMHAADSLIRRSQSVGALVGMAGEAARRYFVTGAANPCLSPFFPIFDKVTDIPEGYEEGGADFDPEPWWWWCERFHRRALRCFPSALKDMQRRMGEYEVRMLGSLEEKTAPLDQAEIDRRFAEVREIVRDWGRALEERPETKTNLLFRRYWNGFNKRNGMSEP